MIVKLPRAATGEEIVHAFSEISTYFHPGEVKLDNARFHVNELTGQEYIGEYEYRPGSMLMAVRTKGVVVRPWRYRRKGIFRKTTVYEEIENVKFDLRPLRLEGTYTEVKISIEYIYRGRHLITQNPHDPRSRYRDIQPLVERMLSCVYKTLTPPQEKTPMQTA